MEWYIILLLFLLLILFIGLIIAVVCVLSDQTCTISLQQRTTNPELTRMQQEQEEKQRKKFTNRFKRTFNSSEKSEQPLVPVEDVKTVELTFKLGNDQKNAAEEFIIINESSNIVSDQPNISQSELAARQKRRESREKLRDDMRRKYSC